MSEEKHSPLPWHVQGGTNVDAGDVHVDGVRVAKCWTSTFAPPLQESAANAALIVRAVNAHAALLAACEAAEEVLASVAAEDAWRAADRALAAVRAAIASARGA